MTAKVLPFPQQPTEAQGWICGCGGFHWVLYSDGSILCAQCECISTVIKVVRASDEPSADSRLRRIPTNADVDYVLQVYRPEGPAPDGHSFVYVDSPTVRGVHCCAETAEQALIHAPAQVRQLRKDNESAVKSTGEDHG